LAAGHLRNPYKNRLLTSSAALRAAYTRPRRRHAQTHAGPGSGGPRARLVAARVDRAGLRRHGAQHAPDRVRDELAAGGDAVVLLARHLHHAAALALEELPRAATPPMWAGRGRAACSRGCAGATRTAACAMQPSALKVRRPRRQARDNAYHSVAVSHPARSSPPQRASCSSRPLTGARRKEVRGALHPLRLRRDAHALEHQVEPRPAARAAVRAKHGVRAQHVHLVRVRARQAVTRRSAQAVKSRRAGDRCLARVAHVVGASLSAWHASACAWGMRRSAQPLMLRRQRCAWPVSRALARRSARRAWPGAPQQSQARCCSGGPAPRAAAAPA